MILEFVCIIEFFIIFMFIGYYFKNIEIGIKKALGKGRFIKVWEFAAPNIVTEHTKLIDANGAIVFNNQMVTPAPGNTFSLKRRAFGDEPLLIAPRGEVPTHIQELANIVEDHTDGITKDIGELNKVFAHLYDIEGMDENVIESLKTVEKNITKIIGGVVLQPGDFLGRAVKYKLIDTREVAKAYNSKMLQILYRLKDIPLHIFILILVVICVVFNGLIWQTVTGLAP